MGHLTIGVFPVLVAQATSQLLLALVLVIVFARFHRAYGHSYLRHWGLAWAALVVCLVASAASGISADIDPLHPPGAVLVVALVASYLQVAWLLLGAWELANEAQASRATERWALAVAVAAGLGSVIAQFAGWTTTSLLNPRCLVSGIAYLAGAATIVLRRRPLPLGRGLAGLALVLYAADQLVYFALGFRDPADQVQVLPLPMSFDLVATAVIGLALVAWLLEGERERLEHAGELARRRERVQACVYAISEAARTVRDLPQLYRSIHESLQVVLPARNFYVALHDRASGLVSFPYFADEHDPVPPARALGRGLTEYVLRTGRALLATPEVIEDLHARGEIARVVCGRVDWLGAPLLERGEPIGVAAIQTHDPAVRLGPPERDLFVFVAEQIASAIEAKRTEEALRQSEARLGMAIGQVPAILWTTDAELRCTTALGAGLLGLGLANAAVGASVADVLGSEDAAVQRHRAALAGESVSYAEERAGRGIHGPPRAPAQRRGGYRGHDRDRLGRDGEAQADLALRESEARLRQVMDLVPHFIFAKDEEGRFLLVNRARGRGLRDDRRTAGRPHRRGLRAVRGGSPSLPRGRPRGDQERPAQGRPRGADHRLARARPVSPDDEDPVRVLGHGTAGDPRRLDRHHGAQGGRRGVAARGEGGEPLRAGWRHRPRLQQPARGRPGPCVARAEAAVRREPRTAPRREGGGGRGARLRPDPTDARLLGPGSLRGPPDGLQRARPREPAAAPGRGPEERAPREAARRHTCLRSTRTWGRSSRC